MEKRTEIERRLLLLGDQVAGEGDTPSSPSSPPSPMGLFERALHAFGYRAICGIDEAGRGPLAGPVVAAAVILPLSFPITGIRDSKQLTPSQRECLFPLILDGAISVGVGVVDNETIDRINILKATLLAMEKSLSGLSTKPDYLLIDALTLSSVVLPQKGIIHGDSQSVSIAAASIVAKVTRDRMMNQYHDAFPEYNFAAHKGYGTKEHLDNLKRYGPCPLHRKTFQWA